jgi:ferredoxin-NADP reductase
MVRTLADRGDRRPVTLFYAASDWTRVVFRDELDALQARLALDVVYVFERPAPEWTGERGFITAEMLQRRLPPGYSSYDAFVCGPLPMMASLERILLGIGMPADRIHTERFQMV